MTRPAQEVERTVTHWLHEAESVTVLTGAGVSTDSGIPDFRGPQGVWTKDPSAQALFTIDNYLADPEVRRRSWRERLENPVWDAAPSRGHRALVKLETQRRLRAIVTQNIDGLHQSAGSSNELVIELHGTIHRVTCLFCSASTPMLQVLQRVRAGERDPSCPDCGGILKSATVSFGQRLDTEVLAVAADASRDCDLFLAVGTSLAVHPAAGLCDYALSAGARLVVLNEQQTPYDADAHAVIRKPIGEVLPRLVADGGG